MIKEVKEKNLYSMSTVKICTYFNLVCSRRTWIILCIRIVFHVLSDVVFHNLTRAMILSIKLIVAFVVQLSYLWNIKFLLWRIEGECDKITSFTSIKTCLSRWSSIDFSIPTSQKKSSLMFSYTIWWLHYILLMEKIKKILTLISN